MHRMRDSVSFLRPTREPPFAYSTFRGSQMFIQAELGIYVLPLSRPAHFSRLDTHCTLCPSGSRSQRPGVGTLYFYTEILNGLVQVAAWGFCRPRESRSTSTDELWHDRERGREREELVCYMLANIPPWWVVLWWHTLCHNVCFLR